MYPDAIQIKRRDLARLIDVAFNHILGEKMVGLESTTGEELEQVLLNFPCLYCGQAGLVHNEGCDREFWRGEPTYERILREYGERNESYVV